MLTLDRKIQRVLTLLFVLLGAFGVAAQEPQNAGPSERVAIVVETRDAIGPATGAFFLRALETAQQRGAKVVVFQLDTPGGLDSAMRDMIRGILASPIPVVTFVAPSGARAASAGTYLLYASHIAAMTHATNLGAATPVQIGGAPAPAPQPGDNRESDAPLQSEEPANASERKAINDSVAYIRGLAELRGRNAEWAEAAVRTAASLSATAALEQNVIDVIANDIPDLLRQIDGRMVQVGDQQMRLDTSELTLERQEMDWRTRFLAVITNPNVAYMLMLAGIYGLLLEGYNPGAILPGVVGAISLLLALYAFQVLSVNYAGLALIVLGLALIVAEAFSPSFGVLGMGGVAAFVVGSVILMDTNVPGFHVARSLLVGVALAGAALVFLTAWIFGRSRRRPVVTGQEQMLTEMGRAVEDFDESGFVQIRGEIWRAITDTPIRKDQPVRVVQVDGLTLHVTPLGRG